MCTDINHANMYKNPWPQSNRCNTLLFIINILNCPYYYCCISKDSEEKSPYFFLNKTEAKGVWISCNLIVHGIVVVYGQNTAVLSLYSIKTQ